MSDTPKAPDYRAEAVASATSVAEVEDALEIVRPPLLALCGLLAVMVLGLVVWSSITDMPIKVSGPGIILSSGGLINVVSDTEGRVLEIVSNTGEFVPEGGVIAVVDQSELRLQILNAEGELADAQRGRDDLLRFQARDTAADTAWRGARDEGLAQNLRSLEERQRLMTEREQVMRDLADRSLATRDRAIGARVELFTVREQIEAAQNERRVLAMDAMMRQTQRERDMLNVEQRLATSARMLTTLNERLRRSRSVLSPFAGRVAEVRANVGEVVTRGEPLLTLLRSTAADAPPAPLNVLVYVGVQDGKKLHIGMRVEISPASTRRQEHGYLVGRVTRVADTPASNAGMLRVLQNDALMRDFQAHVQAPFEVDVELQTDAAGRLVWSGGTGPNYSIEGGTPVLMDATVRQIRVIALALPVLQRWLGRDVVSSAAAAQP